MFMFSALDVLHNRALQIDIYLLVYSCAFSLVSQTENAN